MRRTLSIAAFTILSLGLAAPAAAGDIDWPQFRFTDAHTGVNRFEKTLDRQNVPRLELKWQAQLGDIVDLSSPAVADGVVYIGSIDGTLWAYPADGCGSGFCDVPLWQSANLAQIMDSPTVANGIVYVGSQTDADSNDGKLNAFAASGCGGAQCAPLWQGEAGGDSVIGSSPAVANGVVYVGTFAGRLYAFDADGCGAALCPPLWVGKTGGTIESTPTVYKGLVYVGSDDGKLNVFEAGGCGKALCKPKWTGDLGSPAYYSSPAISNGVVYIGAAHALSAFDAKCAARSCAPLWQALDNDDFFNGSPAVHGGHVYIGWATSLAAYPAAGCGQPVCDKEWVLFGDGFQAAMISSPTIANGVVYAGRNTGEVLAWKEGSCGHFLCHEIWTGRTEDSIVSSSPAVVNGKVYIGSSDKQFPEDISGRLYVYSLPRRRQIETGCTLRFVDIARISCTLRAHPKG